VAKTQIELYEGNGEAAYEEFEKGWLRCARPTCCTCPIPASPPSTARARRAGGGGDRQGTERAQRLRVAEWGARRLGREPRAWGPALGALIQSGSRARPATSSAPRPGLIAGFPGRRAGPGHVSDRGAHDGAEMFGDAAAGADAQTWMAHNRVRAPAALARMLVPGTGPPPPDRLHSLAQLR